MASKKKTPETRHGRRADGKTSTSISLSEDLLAKARAAAEEDGRSFSNWIEQQLKDALKAAGKLSLLAFALFHLTRSPSDWSSKALLATGKAAIHSIGRALA